MIFYKPSVICLIITTLIIISFISITFIGRAYVQEEPIAKPNNYLYPISSKDLGLNKVNELRVIGDYDNDGLPDAIIVNSTHLTIYYSSSNPIIIFTGLPPLYIDSLSHFYVLDNLLFLISSYSNDLRLTVVDLVNRSVVINTIIDRPFIGLGVHGFLKENNSYTIYIRIFDPFRFKEGILPIKFISNVLNESYVLIEDPYYPDGIELTYNVINGFSGNSSVVTTYNLNIPINIFYSSNESFTVSSINWSIYFDEEYISMIAYDAYLLITSKSYNKYYLRIMDPLDGTIVYSKYVPLIIGNYVFIDYYLSRNRLSILYKESSSYRIYYYTLPDLTFLGYIEFPSSIIPLAPLMDIDGDGLQEYLIVNRDYLGIIYTNNITTEMIKWIPSTYMFDWKGAYVYGNQTYIYIIMDYMDKGTLFLLKLDMKRTLDKTPPNILINSPIENILESPISINATILDDRQIYSLEISISDYLGNTLFYKKIYNNTCIIYTIDLEPGHYILNISATNIDGLHSYATHVFAVVEKENPPTKPLIIITEPKNWSVISWENLTLSLTVIYPEPIDLYVYINNTYITLLHGNNSLSIDIDLSNIPDGIYMLTINTSNVHVKLYVIKDVSPPILNIINPLNETIIDHRFNLIFSVSDIFLKEVYVYIDDIRLFFVRDPAERFFSININPWIYGPGRHVLTIIVSDIAEHIVSKNIVLYFNISVENIHVHVSVNTTNASHVQGILQINITCSQDLVGIIRLTNIPSEETYVVGQWSGNTSYLLDTSLYPDGTYRLSIDIIWPNGSYTNTWYTIVYIDNNVPELTIQIPWDISVYGYFVPVNYLEGYRGYYGVSNVLVTIYEPFLKEVKVNIDNQWYNITELIIRSWNFGNGFQASLIIPVSGSGSTNITFYALDAFGHYSLATITLYLDLEPPIVSGVRDIVYSKTRTINLTINADDLSGIVETYLVINGSRYPFNLNHTLSLNLDSGIWKGYIIIEDRVGNVFNKSITLIIDNEAPFIKITYSLFNISNGYELDLIVYVRDNISGLHRVDIFINEEKVLEKEYSSEKEDILTLRKILRYRQDLVIYVEAYDNLGNMGNYTYYIELEKTPEKPNTPSSTTPIGSETFTSPITIIGLIILALVILIIIYWKTKIRKTS